MGLVTGEGPGLIAGRTVYLATHREGDTNLTYSDVVTVGVFEWPDSAKKALEEKATLLFTSMDGKVAPERVFTAWENLDANCEIGWIRKNARHCYQTVKKETIR